ncbi:MAG: hypothetical protein VB082_03280 [Christensenella sp.]|nr:hypothetical protein [Christensenella sp.]
MKKISFLVIGIVLFSVAGWLLLAAGIEAGFGIDFGAVIFLLIVGGVLVALGVWMMMKMQKLPNPQRPPRPQKPQKEEKMQKPIQPKPPKPPKAKIYKGLKVLGGLPVPEGSPCVVSFDGKMLVVNTGGTQYCLDATKLRSAELSEDINRQVYSKGSFGGGLVGGALFGIAGAVIGSAPKKVVETQVLRGSIIGYDDIQTGEIAYIVLSDMTANTFVSFKLIKRIKPYVQIKNIVHHL